MIKSSPRHRFGGYLPSGLMTVLEATGDEDLVWRIAARAAGRDISVPVTLTASCELVEALGPTDGARAWEAWRKKGAMKIYVPMMTTALALRRGQRLLSLVEGGCTVYEAARRCGLSERGAYKAMARARKSMARGDAVSRQMDMFPA